MEVSSPVFKNGGPIPAQYTCRGQNINPPLSIFDPPAGTQSLTLILHDPDAVSGDYLHWLVWDIPPGTASIGVNELPPGAVQGKNGGGQIGYSGPCPPAGSGTHRYMFELYALDTTLDLPTGTSLAKVEAAIKDHILEHTLLTGTFAAET